MKRVKPLLDSKGFRKKYFYKYITKFHLIDTIFKGTFYKNVHLPKIIVLIFEVHNPKIHENLKEYFSKSNFYGLHAGCN
jgi:hypothetical protein